MENNATTFTLNTAHDDRSWHLMCRDDKSVCLYWTRDSDPGQYVVYDSLDEDGLAALRSQNDNLSQQVANLSVELGKALRQRDKLRTMIYQMSDYASSKIAEMERYLATPA
jgi:hypothetical protein